GLDDAPVVDDQGVGDHGIGDFGCEPLALAHAVSNHLAAAELHFLAVDGVVGLDFDPEVGVGEPHPIADGWSVHLRIRLSRDPHGASPSCPLPRAWKPNTRPAPPSRSSVTVRVWPGSKRAAVPAGMSRRKPRAAWRSKASASLVSWKW